ncbi:MAG: anhydro-N-acetylmuramic acid kinase [Firmicutes bacterium]|nr:anhydro-N-acetylmuramic acid kinase [Bacillota bacterium]
MGLNSGSSLDSVDAVLLDMEMDREGWPRLNRVVAYQEFPWPEVVHGQVLRAINLDMSIDEFCRLNFVVGATFARHVLELLSTSGVQPQQVAVIGVDGQTIYQEPPEPERWQGNEWVDPVSALLDKRLGATLQIGEGAVIAALTGIRTVTHFRPADMALGGTGAPIEQFLDYVHYRHQAPLITLNIGGIANIHAIHPDRGKIMAFDTGPGNILMDRLAQEYFGVPYDRDGTIARKGHVQAKVLEFLLDHPFLKRKPPRSAWREDFSEAYLREVLSRFPTVPKEDMMATFAEFTVRAIVLALQQVPFLDDVRYLVGNGGGVLNAYLRERLESLLPPSLTFALSDAFGIPAKANEAAKFGTLGYAHIMGVPGNIPHASGAKTETILGKLHNPPSIDWKGEGK